MTRLTKIGGVPVFSSTKPLTFQVDEKDIKKSKPHSADTCAVAVACREHLKIIDVRVHMSRAYLRFSKVRWMRFTTPPSLKAQLVAFDRGEGFRPGTYRLLPAPASKAGHQFSSNGKRSRMKPYAFTQRVREIAGGLDTY